MSCTSNAIAGFEAQLYYSIDGGTSKLKLAEIRDASFNVETDPIDVTSHDSEGWREFIAGLGQWGISGERLHTPDKSSQGDLWTMVLSKAKIDVYFRPKDLAGKIQWQGKAVLINYEVSAPNDDATMNNVEFQGCGKPQETTIV